MGRYDYVFPKVNKKNFNRYCRILSTASYLPETVISNDDIISRYELPFKSAAIVKSLGVEIRHEADNRMADSDVLQLSAAKCLRKYGLTSDNLSRIIVNKYFGDNILPMTASKLQVKLNSNTAVHAFDIDGGISSFLFAVDVASRFINTGDEYILIASGGIHRRLVSKTDPRIAFLFGDASASVLFGCAEEPHILASYFYSNHHFYDLFTAISPLTLADLDEYLMDGTGTSVLFDTYRAGNWKAAEDFYAEASRVVSQNLLDVSGLCMDDIDLVLVTENNKKIWELTLEAIGVPESKSSTLIRSCGNTMSAMLPLLLDREFEKGRIQSGMHIMLISHGEGISGGGIIYRV